MFEGIAVRCERREALAVSTSRRVFEVLDLDGNPPHVIPLIGEVRECLASLNNRGSIADRYPRR